MSAFIDKLKESREESNELPCTCCLEHFDKLNSKLDKIIRILEMDLTRTYNVPSIM